MSKSAGNKNKKRPNSKMNDQRKQVSRPVGQRPGAPAPNPNSRNTAQKAQLNSQNKKKQPQMKPKQSKQPQNKPAQSPSQRRKTNKAYDRAVVHRNVKGRKHGSRGRNFIMYYILGAVVIITVLIILSNTVLFNCSSITVEGNSRYTAEQIISQSGLEKGENLLHTDADAAKQRIFTAFSYIDKVEVQKCFPTRINIVVQEAEKWFQVTSGGNTAAVSRLGRIVELGSDSTLPAIKGYEPAELAPGAMLTSSDSGKNQIPMQILEAAEKCGVKDITEIDITDRFDIKIECGDDVTLEIGGMADIESKFTAAVQAMRSEHSGVVLDLKQPDMLFARDKVDELQVLPTLGGTEEPTNESTAESDPAA